MRIALALLTAAVTFVITPGSLLAHHSILAYELEPLWVQGAVVSFERADPHTITTLEAQRADGRVQRWRVEGPRMARLERAAEDLYFPEVGDVIRFCALPYKPLEELQRLWPEADFSATSRVRIQDTEETVTQTVDGHIMVRPDGAKQVWDSPGILAACMSSSGDSPESWLAIVSSRRQAWCRQIDNESSNQQDATLQAYVEEIDTLLDSPCE